MFFIFFCSGRGEGGVRGRREAGGSIFIENPRKGGSLGGEGTRGRESVGGELGIFGEGG